MTWPDYLPIGTGVLYAIAAVGYWTNGERGLGFMYASYALANVGLVWAAVEGRG